LIGISIAQTKADELQSRDVAVSAKDEVIMLKLNCAGISGFCDWRTNDLIQQDRISHSLNSQLQIGTGGRQTENTGVEVDYVGLGRAGKKSLRKAVTLGVGPRGQCRGMRTARSPFGDLGNIPDSCP
jgi:hypothetical protein